MRLLLAVDTCNAGCSVACFSENSLIAESALDIPGKQGERLAGMIQGTLAKANKTLEDIEGFAVTVGPGSFTGVRIGLTLLKGMQLAIPAPIYAITTLEAAAWQAAKDLAEDKKLIVALNASRNQYFRQEFTWYAEAKQLTATSEITLKQDDAFSVAEGTIAIGSALPLQKISSEKYIAVIPDAIGAGGYALSHPEQIKDRPPVPIYVRAPDAKLPTQHGLL